MYKKRKVFIGCSSFFLFLFVKETTRRIDSTVAVAASILRYVQFGASIRARRTPALRHELVLDRVQLSIVAEHLRFTREGHRRRAAVHVMPMPVVCRLVLPIVEKVILGVALTTTASGLNEHRFRRTAVQMDRFIVGLHLAMMDD